MPVRKWGIMCVGYGITECLMAATRTNASPVSCSRPSGGSRAGGSHAGGSLVGPQLPQVVEDLRGPADHASAAHASVRSCHRSLRTSEARPTMR
jgi:hypothetical protein